MEEIAKIKYENYREQNKRLKKALTEGFYLEAIFIVYVMLEDRADAILRYTDTKVKGYGLKPKLRKIEEVSREKKAIAHKYFNTEYVNCLQVWVEERNALMHALMKNTHEAKTIEEIAKQGEMLIKELCKKSQLYKKALIRNNQLVESQI